MYEQITSANSAYTDCVTQLVHSLLAQLMAAHLDFGSTSVEFRTMLYFDKQVFVGRSWSALRSLSYRVRDPSGNKNSSEDRSNDNTCYGATRKS